MLDQKNAVKLDDAKVICFNMGMNPYQVSTLEEGWLHSIPSSALSTEYVGNCESVEVKELFEYLLFHSKRHKLPESEFRESVIDQIIVPINSGIVITQMAT
jgi:hypothetical protein